MGMSRDQMAGMLMDQTIISKLSQVDGATAKEKYNNAVKMYGIEKANAMLGDDTLAQQMQSASLQDRFNTSIEKLKEIFVTLAEPLMPVLDAFAGILSVIGAVMKGVGWIFDKLNSLGPVLGKIATTLAAAALAAFMLGTSLTLGVGAAVILAAAAGGIAAYKTYMEPQAVQDGIASPNNGPFTITDKFGATAITATGDGLAVSPNIKTQSVQQSSPMIDYEKLGAHIAQAVSKVQVQTNLDGVSVSRGLQVPMGQTTRKI
jgi:hypothetical protein